MHGTEAIRFAMDDAWPLYMYMITDLATMVLTGTWKLVQFRQIGQARR